MQVLKLSILMLHEILKNVILLLYQKLQMMSQTEPISDHFRLTVLKILILRSHGNQNVNLPNICHYLRNCYRYREIRANFRHLTCTLKDFYIFLFWGSYYLENVDLPLTQKLYEIEWNLTTFQSLLYVKL